MLFFPLLVGIAFGPYTDIPMYGWTVRVARSELADASWKATREELETQLYRIAHVVPDGPLAQLRKIVIWVQKSDAATPCMAYHPAPEWLKEHGVDPNMAHGVELANPATFVSWTYQQPWMVLHELAHAYHDQFLPDGFANKDVKAVWDAEMASKKYDDVLHWNGGRAKHYAETNPMEFFAESTEAYFGQNDFYPFVNAELKTFDPEAFALMGRVWGAVQLRIKN